VYIVGFTEINYDPATDIINEDQSTATVTNLSGSTSTSTTVRRGRRGHAEIPGSVHIVRSSSRDAMDISFQGFKSPSGPIVAYAIIMTTEFHGSNSKHNRIILTSSITVKPKIIYTDKSCSFLRTMSLDCLNCSEDVILATQGVHWFKCRS
ncbi:hypothetical protein AB205_0036750, partial [Aquarana catesbeiana]